MSRLKRHRTERTDPMWVRLHNGDLAAQPFHRCAGTACDLPEKPPLRHDPDTLCSWMFSYTGERVCACQMCSDRTGRRLLTKRRRRQDRQAVEEQLGED